MRKNRAKDAGRQLGIAIVEMAQLMYQKNTKKNFFLGLLEIIKAALEK